MTRLATITVREMAVAAELLADGATNRQIASRLYLTEDTVKSHVKALLKATESQTRAEFVAKVLRGRVRLNVVRRRGTEGAGEHPLRAEAGVAG